MTTIRSPELSLVALVGPSGCGKSTFAAKHFRETEVLSSDRMRAWVSDDEGDQSASADAFAVLHSIAERRLGRGRLTVIDATNVQREARLPLVRIARAAHVLPVAIVFDLPARICLERNEGRPERSFGPHVVHQQRAQLSKSLRNLKKEGFRHVYVLRSVEEIDAATVVRDRLWSDRKDDHGPFDIIGDVHGCRAELESLLARLGYARDEGGVHRHPEGRRVIFLGDLVDRGPDVPGVLRIAMAMVRAGTALSVPGNHEVKLERKLNGKSVRLTHGLAETVEQLDREPPSFVDEVRSFIDSLVSHYVLDDGRLVVAHAGISEPLQGRASGRVRQFCLYGETTGETDDLGLPVRVDWARSYRGRAAVVYGHTPVSRAQWVNNTICIDTGCVFGGKLTALRWPERELASVDAERVHYAPTRPLAPPAPERDVLDIGDVTGQRIVENRFSHPVTIREENASAALEVMSRFAIDPRWLVYLPPTMSPPAATREPGFLEHPREAFAYFRERGVREVVCEEKHMGSRAVVVLCRDVESARARFGDARLGVIYTRTGRPFFDDAAMEGAILERLASAAERAGLFGELGTSWMVLDTELLPWSAKAGALIREQYARVGAAGTASLTEAVALLERTAQRGIEGAAELLERTRRREARVARYVEAYGRYCWPVQGIDDLRVAPFHLLASEGGVHVDRDHAWHMETLARLAAEDPKLVGATAWWRVDLDDEASERDAIARWLELTERGGEGMVVKPLSWLAHDERGLVQPAIKCRGREYLRIIYGPEHTDEDVLARLRKRSTSAKRRLAVKELALGLEGLARFVEGEPLHRVHECAFGVLALESVPVDPRL